MQQLGEHQRSGLRRPETSAQPGAAGQRRRSDGWSGQRQRAERRHIVDAQLLELQRETKRPGSSFHRRSPARRQTCVRLTVTRQRRAETKETANSISVLLTSLRPFYRTAPLIRFRRWRFINRFSLELDLHVIHHMLHFHNEVAHSGQVRKLPKITDV